MSQILCEIFVRNLFGAFKDLHTCMLRCALAHLSPGFLWKSQKCRSGLSSFVVFLWHSMGGRQECWLMHQESPPGNSSNRPLFLMSNFCQPSSKGGKVRTPGSTDRHTHSALMATLPPPVWHMTPR